ncbi:TPA: hypothetical protein ACM4AF_005411 [Escherichia coli]|uniref:hypothetical protein n=1 Tax=Escherichia coli TaxID=562 RepID=UPI00198286CD|nr:hypothetical protein [Escherichia coli]
MLRSEKSIIRFAMFWQFSYALSKATFACSTPLVIMSYRPGLARCITIAGRLAAAPVAP